MVTMTVMYKQGINLEYYLNRHLGENEGALKALGVRLGEVRRLQADVQGNLPAYEVIATLYFDNMEAFQTAMQSPLAAKLMEDIPNFYSGAPDMLVGEVIYEKNFRK